MEHLQNESGRTMLEMLGVLGIMGIIMYGAVSGINYGMSTYKVNQVYNDVQDQMQGITDLYSWSRAYPTGDFTERVCENDIFSQSCSGVDSAYPFGKKGTHAFGGEIQVVGDNSNFILRYSKMDNSACERLREMEWGNVVLITPEEGDDCNETMEWTWK